MSGLDLKLALLMSPLLLLLRLIMQHLCLPKFLSVPARPIMCVIGTRVVVLVDIP